MLEFIILFWVGFSFYSLARQKQSNTALWVQLGIYLYIGISFSVQALIMKLLSFTDMGLGGAALMFIKFSTVLLSGTTLYVLVRRLGFSFSYIFQPIHSIHQKYSVIVLRQISSLYLSFASLKKSLLGLKPQKAGRNY
jgi:hypothetical protein